MIRFAFKNLLTRPMRTLLALVGLTVAISGMVGLFSVAEGIDDVVARTFGKIPGLVVMQPGAPIPLFSRLPKSWGDEISKLKGVRVVNPEVWTRAHVIEGKHVISPPRFVFGVEIETTHKLRRGVYKEAIKEGRFLEPSDHGTLNAVVSRGIADEFQKKLGDTLRLDGRTLTIVGIYETGSLLLDVAVLVDVKPVREMGRFNTDTVCSFYVEPETEQDRTRLVKEMKVLFKGRSPDAWQPASALDQELVSAAPNPVAGLLLQLARFAADPQVGSAPATPSPVDPQATADVGEPELPVEIRSSDDWATQFGKFSADLNLFLGIMTSIGVVIAVLGIVNTMLMSVTERFIEFGILKANGWTDRDVLTLIAWESSLLGVSGGVLGALFGWIATEIINARYPTRVHLYASPQLLIFSMVFSTLVGLLGGLYPAYWAARMVPMEAIRRG